jgi:hypothetical protein
MSLKETKHGFARVLTNKYFYLMKQSIAFETILFALMLVSTIVILISMGVRDVNVCLLAFATFLFSAVSLIVKLKK